MPYRLKRNYPQMIVLILFSIVVLYFVERANYLLFHVLAEMITVVVAFALFTITWNARKMMDNNYLLLFGIASLFLGFLDLLHIISYTGMDVFKGEIYYANQTWIATRFMEASTYLFGFLFVSRKKVISSYISFGFYFFLTALAVFAIFILKIFPACYIEGVGQTEFKLYAEYLIILLLGISLIILFIRKNYFEYEVYVLISLSIAATIFSEICFTLYFSNFGMANQAGHYFKMISFLLLYKATIETGFARPSRIIYKNLQESKDETARLNKKLLDQLATKNKFFSIISHDLKSPLASLVMVTDNLLKRYEVEPVENIRFYIENINRISNNTFNLVENLLDWARIENGSIRFNPENLDISKVIDDVVELYKDPAKTKGIQISVLVESGRYIWADKDMLKAILRNLISNALKYSFPGGEIRVKTGVDSNKVWIEIEDTGTGMSRDVINALFSHEKMISHPGTSDEKGTGLGLFLVKEFVERNEGRMRINSEEGKGSSFTVIFKEG